VPFQQTADLVEKTPRPEKRRVRRAIRDFKKPWREAEILPM